MYMSWLALLQDEFADHNEGRLYSKTCRAESIFLRYWMALVLHTLDILHGKGVERETFSYSFPFKKILKYRQYTNRESSNSNAAIAIMLATEVHVVAEICATNPSITKIATINHHLGLLLLNGFKKSLIRISFMLVIKSCAKIQFFLR